MFHCLNNLYPLALQKILFGKHYNNLNVIVYNVMGQIIQNHKLNSINRTEINIETSGIYLIKVINNKGFAKTFKAVKE